MVKKSKKTALKKKRVSKHMLKSRKGIVTAAVPPALDENDKQINPIQKDAMDTSSGWKTPNSTKNTAETISTSRKSRKDGHVKDPEEATAYLTTWKAFQQNNQVSSSASSVGWKFNKNTQSWLIRHMYEIDKVSKGTFALLLEYLQGLQGQQTQLRIVSEATRRARRYKNHAQNQQENISSSEANDNDGDKDDHIASINIQSNTTTTTTTTTKTTESTTSKEDWERQQEETRWKQLCDNDKRKEYKRARKVLDVIKIGCQE
jgi:hypothetical protein